MGMSCGDKLRIKKELLESHSAFYEIPSAWLRELLAENDHINKVIAELYSRPSKEKFDAIAVELDELKNNIKTSACFPCFSNITDQSDLYVASCDLCGRDMI